jgi:hypothetical protein
MLKSTFPPMPIEVEAYINGYAWGYELRPICNQFANWPELAEEWDRGRRKGNFDRVEHDKYA